MTIILSVIERRKGKCMEFLTTEKYGFFGYDIVEHIVMLQDKMVFMDGSFMPLSLFLDELPEEEIVEQGDEFRLEKELVKDALISAAKDAGANAIIGLKFEVCAAAGGYIVIYGNGTAVKIERVQ